MYALTVAFFVALCCLFKDIAVSVGVLKTSALVVVRNFRILLMPFFSAILLAIWSSVWVANFSYLMSSGEITQPIAGSQMKVIKLSDVQQYMVYLHLFMFFWVFEFI